MVARTGDVGAGARFGDAARHGVLAVLEYN